MKKLFLIGLATAAMLASCSNDEMVEMTQPEAIGFSQAFVNNGTRSVADPSLTKETLGSFAVYGFTQNGPIFNGTVVSSQDKGATWTYNPLQYWVAGNTYTFGAIAPAATPVEKAAVADGKVGMTVSFTSDGATDLLHAAPAAVVADEKFVQNPTAVAMTFNHQLSKVKFSFDNYVGEGYNVKVTDIKIKDAKQTGTLTIGAQQPVWSNQTGTLELAFGNVTEAQATSGEAAAIAYGEVLESYQERLLIPTGKDVSYTVTFTAELLQGNVSMGKFHHSVTVSNVEFKLGYCYDFLATLTHQNIVDPNNPLKPIEFTVTGVTDWNQGDMFQALPGMPPLE